MRKATCLAKAGISISPATTLPIGLLALSPAWLVLLALVLALAAALVLRRRAVRIRRTRARLAAA